MLAEGLPAARIAVTGNTVIDALFWVRDRVMNDAALRASLERRYGFLDGVHKMILVTGHRRESFGDGFERICAALARIALDHPDVQVVYPVHLNPNVSEPVNRMLSGIANIKLIDPQDYLPFVYLMDRATIILTDSGGIQEEAPSLGKPVLVMRDATERPEAVAAGTVRLVGTDEQAIHQAVSQLLNDAQAYQRMSRAHNPYGDGGQIRDWLYVEDHVRALYQMMTRGRPGETYTIGGHNERRNIEVVEALCALLEQAGAPHPAGVTAFRQLITLVEDRPGHDRRYAIDAGKIARELGWRPQETFDSGLAKTVQWYLTHREWWQRVLDGSYRGERLGLGPGL